MRFFRVWLTSMRGRIVTWYVGVLGVLLFGYCAFQTATLTNYFRSDSAISIQQIAAAELASAGGCSLRSASDLRHHATPLAQLLGSGDVEVAIVTPSGNVLAARSPGTIDPLRPSPFLLRQLVGMAATRVTRTSGGALPCQAGARPSPSPTALRSGNILRIAVPLGPSRRPVGYAILGRPTAGADAAVQHARTTLWIGALAVLLITALVALPIMNRALRPLGRVTATAEAIAGGNFDQRANLPPAVDEVGRLGTAFDVMVDRLQDALLQARTSEERMRQFLADASHELRTPLTVLCGTSEILRQHDLDRRETDAAHLAINQEATRMARLVSDLLQLSRLDAGQLPQPQPLVVSALLEDFVARYAPAWPRRPLEVDRSNLNGAQIHADPEALTRVLTNLVDNSARYSTPGRPIRIQGAAVDHLVKITVADEGPGLSPEDAQRAFERFYRGSKSRSRQSGGSGLGLAIVQALVRQSQGEVRLDSAPNRGTTVTITLPRRTELHGSSN